ncbi:MAG: T9SS type A sorting domain-containing protein [Bacteroidetes bacterium]|nr:T9SS type A sorting domain-containing protein [Bacteroidota bacterium]
MQKKLLLSCLISFQLFFAHRAISQSTTSKVSMVPSITIVSNDGNYTEAVGGLCFNISISNPSTTDTTFVDVQVASNSTVTLNSDYFISPTTIAFPPGSSANQSCCVSVLSDALAEPIEELHMQLANPTNNALLVDSLINFTFYDDDSVSTNSPCSDLFFSEYVHSFPFNRAFELYNPTASVANLSDYTIKMYFAGNTVAGTTIPLSGFLNAADTYVISYSGSDSILKSLADTVNGQFFFNAGNVIALYHANTLVDAIGTIGVNPGNYWPVYNSQTSSTVLVRKQNIQQGETTWAVSNGQWDIYPQGDYSHLGGHTINGCGFVVPPTVTMFTSDAAFDEAIGGLGISAKIFNPLLNQAVTVDVVIGSATTATNGIDFTYTPTQLTFPANSTAAQTISISVFDDLSIEPDELVELRLQNVSNGATILDSSWVLTIQNNDFVGIKKQGVEKGISILPNPVKDILTIESAEEIESYQLSNVVGLLCVEESNLTAKQVKLNLSNYPEGVYFIKIKTASHISTRKVVVR